MHIPVLQVDGFEADDVIGTLATAAGREGIETYMLTPDKDYGQLVGDNVYIYRPRHGGGYDTLGESEVTQKYGIATTAQVIDLLALMGDSADNFPGCPEWARSLPRNSSPSLGVSTTCSHIPTKSKAS